MRRSTFAWFVAPSVVMMLVFIAFPLMSVLVQSFSLTQPVVESLTVETCTPSFVGQNCIQETRRQPVLDENGAIVTETRFVGLANYATLVEPGRALAALGNLNLNELLSIDFWRALRFTLTFTLITLPLILVVGLGLALAVNNVTRAVRGPVIFVTLLPFIITPVIGALAIRWLFVSDGILTRLMEHWSGQDIFMFARSWTIELLMMFYRVWHVAPFAFVIFYAGLQGVNQDAVEAALIDGASRLQRLRYIVIPHLMPLIVFVALIHLMDAYRVFEEVIGFRSEAYVISLQYLTYDLLMPDNTGNRAINRASASSMLTMIGIVILLIPLLRHTWRQHRGTR
ncbi:carbohydrate ABC transporter permease [Paracoccus spongiarum]|uniref:Sugar ABC transporter permease n=1 Tax=Paracoccus spongiarum TaxID=3064387 RepID=A0ABT9JIN5_9RHOB|nr:sugar ABC transporter permease [Paracoccus sp. 2205BS29-5]MDP5308911.1 sugar ABC transporter permease [Paracoccus sp. 2205BS29-5]